MTLEEVVARVDALKKDLEDLGADVTVTAAGVIHLGKRQDVVSLLAVVKHDLEEDQAQGVSV